MSGHEHLGEDGLLDAVYGIAGSEADAHLRRCADCAQRLHEWHEKRAASAASVEIPAGKTVDGLGWFKPWAASR